VEIAKKDKNIESLEEKVVNDLKTITELWEAQTAWDSKRLEMLCKPL
jgi:hypothetical protein